MSDRIPATSGRHAPVRSWLFAPGNRPHIVQKALASDADAVIVDLEDAVPLAEKDEARATVAQLLSSRSGDPRIVVRINALSTPFALRDILAVAPFAPGGLMISKTESVRDVATAAWLLEQLMADNPALAGTRLIPLIETAQGIAHVDAIAGADMRIAALAFGAGDYTLDLGLHWSRGEDELMAARSAVVQASRSAAIAAPIDSVWVEMADDEGMTASAGRSRDHGFQGKLCIHPRQVAIVNAAYRPDEQAVERARSLIDKFEAAGEGEDGGAVQIDGRMVDFPIVAAARRILVDDVRARARDAARP